MHFLFESTICIFVWRGSSNNFQDLYALVCIASAIATLIFLLNVMIYFCYQYSLQTISQIDRAIIFFRINSENPYSIHCLNKIIVHHQISNVKIVAFLLYWYMPQLRTFVISAAMTRRFRSSPIKSSLRFTLPETKFRSRQLNRNKNVQLVHFDNFLTAQSSWTVVQAMEVEPTSEQFHSSLVRMPILGKFGDLFLSVIGPSPVNTLSWLQRGVILLIWLMQLDITQTPLFLKSLVKCIRHSLQMGDLVTKSFSFTPVSEATREYRLYPSVLLTASTRHALHQNSTKSTDWVPKGDLGADAILRNGFFSSKYTFYQIFVKNYHYFFKKLLSSNYSIKMMKKWRYLFIFPLFLIV